MDNDGEFYIESEGDEPKQIIVGTKKSYQTFEVDHRGRAGIKMDKVTNPKPSKAVWNAMKRFYRNKTVSSSRGIHIECSKQFKYNFYMSGQSRPL